MNLHRTVYARALGAAFETLPPVLKRLHQGGNVAMEGVLRVRWSEHRGVNAMMRVLPLPRPSQAVPCQVVMTPTDTGERWRRVMGKTVMQSGMSGELPNRIIERIGLLKIELDTWVEPSGRLRQKSRSVSLFGIPFPCLRICASERALSHDRFACDVRIILRRVGCLLRYDGILAIREAQNFQGVVK